MGDVDVFVKSKYSISLKLFSALMLSQLLSKLLFIILNLLFSSESPQFGIRGSAKEKAIRFYRSCMDTERIESQGAQPLKDLLNEVNVCAVSSPSGREFLQGEGKWAGAVV